jgi:hypothetical protein
MVGAAVTARYANGLGAGGRSKICQNLPAVAYQAKFLGILRCDGRDMPMVAPTIEQIATVV